MSSLSEKVVTELESYWNQSSRAAKDIADVRSRVIQTYNAQIAERDRKSIAIQTKTHLSWTARAVDTFVSRLSPLLMPSAQEYFSLQNPQYALACSVMTSLISYFMETAKATDVMDRMTQTLAIEGAIGISVRWDYCYGVDALPRLVVECINAADISVYPVTETLDRATVMVRTYLTRDELEKMAQADSSGSFSLPEINNLGGEKGYTDVSGGRSNLGSVERTQRLGFEVVDYYVPVLELDGMPMYHVRATVVDHKHLIRFTSRELPAQDDSAPESAIYACLMEHYIENVGPVRVGIGICNKALELELAAVTIHNLAIDNIKSTVKPPMGYDPNDTYFNADGGALAPGELVPVSSTHPRHLMPLDGQQRSLPQVEESLSRLMYQFESAVGIPNFLSGVSDTNDRHVSATAKRLEANGADVRLRKYAASINANALRPLTVRVYNMIRSKVMQELALLGAGVPIEKLPFLTQASAICLDCEAWLSSGQKVPPIEALTLSLNTFEDALQRVDQVNNVERAVGTLSQLGAQSPQLADRIMAHVDFDALLRKYLTGLDLQDTLAPVSNVTKALEQAAASQADQQQKQEALQGIQMALAADKEQAAIDKIKAETERTLAEAQKTQVEALKVLNGKDELDEKADTRAAEIQE